MIELATPLPDNRLTNKDLAPTPITERSWSRWNIASLWVGMSVCIPTYIPAIRLLQIC